MCHSKVTFRGALLLSTWKHSPARLVWKGKRHLFKPHRAFVSRKRWGRKAPAVSSGPCESCAWTVNFGAIHRPQRSTVEKGSSLRAAVSVASVVLPSLRRQRVMDEETCHGGRTVGFVYSQVNGKGSGEQGAQLCRWVSHKLTRGRMILVYVPFYLCVLRICFLAWDKETARRCRAGEGAAVNPEGSGHSAALLTSVLQQPVVFAGVL